MSFINKYIALALVLWLPTLCFSQEKENEKSEPDTVRSFRPQGIRIGTDLIGLGKTAFDSDKTEFEINADVQMYRYLLNVEYGQFEVSRAGNDGSIYSSKGSYFRSGVDINLFKKDVENNILFFGLRYGKASFDDQLSYSHTSTTFGTFNDSRSNADLSARWYEFVGGIKLHMKHNIWLGFTSRFKFGLKVDESTALSPHDIPGYGKASEENYWGFNYYLIYRIPFKKAETLSKK